MAEIDVQLIELRSYAEALRLEWQAKNPNWIPSWVEKFQAIDDALSNGGSLPRDWDR